MGEIILIAGLFLFLKKQIKNNEFLIKEEGTYETQQPKCYCNYVRL